MSNTLHYRVWLNLHCYDVELDPQKLRHRLEQPQINFIASFPGYDYFVPFAVVNEGLTTISHIPGEKESEVVVEGYVEISYDPNEEPNNGRMPDKEMIQHFENAVRLDLDETFQGEVSEAFMSEEPFCNGVGIEIERTEKRIKDES